jgi:hypothetical protein
MLETLQHATGGLWPYLVVILFGFLPTEVWRLAGVLAGRNLDETSEVMIWVRLVATALVAGVVAKLILFPTGALAVAPLWARLAALGVGVAGFAILKRNVLAGLAIGEAALIGLGLAFS